jgi:hypothetical protein
MLLLMSGRGNEVTFQGGGLPELLQVKVLREEW